MFSTYTSTLTVAAWKPVFCFLPTPQPSLLPSMALERRLQLESLHRKKITNFLMKALVIKYPASGTIPKGEDTFPCCTGPICKPCLGEHRLSRDTGSQSAGALNYEAWLLTTSVALADTLAPVIEGHPATEPYRESVTFISLLSLFHTELPPNPFPFIRPLPLPEDLAHSTASHLPGCKYLTKMQNVFIGVLMAPHLIISMKCILTLFRKHTISQVQLAAQIHSPQDSTKNRNFAVFNQAHTCSCIMPIKMGPYEVTYPEWPYLKMLISKI